MNMNETTEKKFVRNEQIPVEELCEYIDLLNPCTDNYLYVYDFEKDFYHIAENAVSRFRIPKNSFHDVAKVHEQFVFPEDMPKLLEEFDSIANCPDRFQHDMVYRWLDRSGHPVWINCRGCVVRKDGRALYMVGCINEIGIRQKADNNSGLLNEAGLQAYLENINTLHFSGYLMRLGTDDFSDINEKMGTEYGDFILQELAEAISDLILPGQKLYKLMADEYVVLDPVGGTFMDALLLYKKIRRAVDSIVESRQYEVMVTISCGILEYQDEKITYSRAMRLSEFALNESKRQGKNRWYRFNEEDYQKFLRKNALTQALHQSVKEDFRGFSMHLQPIFSANDGKLKGAEVLMRFWSKELGTVSPGEFIPILEETGLIIPAGRWILMKAFSICKKILSRVPDFFIGVNISYVQVLKSNIFVQLMSLSELCGLPPQNILVEMTETGLVEKNEKIRKLWRNLKKSGIKIALDDFGTGYSNFCYLNELKPDVLKIDRTFTAEALQNEYQFRLLQLLGQMGHSLNMRICVEGIETQEEHRHLLEIIPDFFQGFYFGKPCTFEDFWDSYVETGAEAAAE